VVLREGKKAAGFWQEISMKSLLIVGQPRGFTSEAHSITAKATQLDPSPIGAGEVLNRDRNSKVKFPHYSKCEDSYAAFSDVLAQYKDGFCVKDVVQPFGVSRYIKEHPDDYNVLVIDRPIRQRRLFQGLKGWDYPQLDLKELFPGRITVQYDYIIYDSAPFFDALEAFGYTVHRFRYHLDADFIVMREVTLAKSEMAEAILDLIPEGNAFILVDEDQWATGEDILGRRRIPFLERDGQYWGRPADDETAVRELERLRQNGAGFIVFPWQSLWWLDFYKAFNDSLRSRYRCLLQNERLVIFDLRK
jgi:hypothetical protein